MMPVEFDVTGKVVPVTRVRRGIVVARMTAGAGIAPQALEYVEGMAAKLGASARRLVAFVADAPGASAVHDMAAQPIPPGGGLSL